METLAILVAAGRGERMGAGRPKAFLALAGQSLLRRSAVTLDAAQSVDALVAVVPFDVLGMAREDLAGITKLRAVVAGGPRRQDSVWEGLRQVPRDFEGVVLVHDAARPFVEVSLIDAVARAAKEGGAAIPVLDLADTIKRVRHERVVETLDRTELGAAQTPQGFRCSLLMQAYEGAFRDGVTLTDESMAVERLGATVTAIAGSPGNRKMTTPEDLAWAESVLARRAVR